MMTPDREPTDEELRHRWKPHFSAWQCALCGICADVPERSECPKLRALFNAGLAKGEARAREAVVPAVESLESMLRYMADGHDEDDHAYARLKASIQWTLESLQPQEPKMADKQESGLACACLHVIWCPIDLPGGMKRERWVCGSCGNEFTPKARLTQSTETAEQLRARVGELEMALDLRGALLATIRDMLGKGSMAHPIVTDESDPRWHPAIAATLSAMTRIAELDAEVARLRGFFAQHGATVVHMAFRAAQDCDRSASALGQSMVDSAANHREIAVAAHELMGSKQDAQSPTPPAAPEPAESGVSGEPSESAGRVVSDGFT